MTERRLDHLDPATIAALVDRTLGPAARAAAEAHLADCADCREVWVETSEIAGETSDAIAATPATVSNVVPLRRRSRGLIYAGAGLAAAAAIGLAVMSPRLFDRSDQPNLSPLVQAVGTARSIDSRLTGGFAWGERPQVTREAAASATPRVRIEANTLITDLADRDDAAALRAVGVAQLLTGQLDLAVQSFQKACSRAPGSAAAWSDLASAYLERGRIRGDDGDYRRAEEAAARAIAIAPLPEALFNRAIAFEYLELKAEADAGWRAYLNAEPSGAWAREARQRLSALEVSR